MSTSGWERFRGLFAIDFRSLALFRCALGLLILTDLVLRFPWLMENYTAAGILPADAVRHVNPLFSFFLIRDSYSAQVFGFGTLGLAATLLLVGYRTRMTTVLCWLLLGSLQTRNADLGNAGDSLLRTLLLWSAFLPLGARFSIDALRGRGGGHGATHVTSVASAALLLQFVWIYLFGGIHKWDPDWLSNGLAIERVLNGDYAQQPMASWLLQAPGLLRIMSRMVIPFEVLTPLLMFVPIATERLRMALLVAAWLFQLSLGLGIDLHLFPFVSTTASLPFLPALFWDRILRCRAPRPAAAVADATGPPATTPLRRFRGYLAQTFVAGLILYSFAANLHSARWIVVPGSLRAAAEIMMLRQGWHLYAPHPPLWDPEWFTYGLLENGRGIDLRSTDHWNSLAAYHESHRLRRYLDHMVRPPKGGRTVALYADFLCRRWNAVYSGEDRLSRIRLLFTQEWALDAHGPVDRRYLLLEHECGSRV